MNIFIKTISAFLLSLTLFVAMPVFAAEMFFEQEKKPGLENQFKMGIFLETEEPLNAIEGKINFPIGLLELQNVEDGNSIINFWLERPTAGKTGEITFSGITPGGYKGNQGLIFSMTFLVKQEGVGIFEVHDARVLRNDGKGTEAKLQTFSSKFVISRKTTDVQIPVVEIKDVDLPESFVPEIARDPNILDDKWFLVFATQDKASGIDFYEVKESRQRLFSIFKSWMPAESPYVLNDQELHSYIFIKAVDKGGNERVITLPPQKPLAWYENYENWIMIIVGVLAILLATKKLWRKKHI